MVTMAGWNKRVLELGAASGYMTRALVAQSCRVTAIEYDPEAAVDLKGVADEVIIGDLNDPDILAGLEPSFDVVVAGDVLEHLLDPQRVLNQATQLLAAGGRVIVSLPNVAHADVRLSLLQGRFEYHPSGLLDETHIRFFTLRTIEQLVQRAGLVIIDLQRVRMPVFGTDLGVNRASVATAVLEEILEDPEAETYQFVFTAVRADADQQVAELAPRYTKLQADHDQLKLASQAQQVRLAELGDVAARNHALRAEIDRLLHVKKELEARTAAFRERSMAFEARAAELEARNAEIETPDQA